MPGGMDRHSDGWKLSVRLRLMHARSKRLLAPDTAWGTPIGTPHMGFGIAAFPRPAPSHSNP